MPQQDIDRTKPATRAFVLYPHLKDSAQSGINPEERLEEACGLAEAIHVEIVAKRWVNLKEIKPATLVGGGLIEEIIPIVQQEKIDLIVVDAALSPIQQRNLEKKWQTKVIDRTGLILEIFGERAQTAEGTLQVELAALEFQQSRLVRSWTHLERQRGGLGFIGGPGESQLEIDKRLIGERITKIKKELEKVIKRRALHRKRRKKAPYPIVALAGYTNAGKSTLFNLLTDEKILAKDMLFATLDPTLRMIKLPSGREVILLDTVGFISQLPTQLIAAFRATLEEIIEADLILHVRDMSNKNTEIQAQDVYQVLEDIGVKQEDDSILEIYNKIDLLEKDQQQDLQENKNNICISALKGTGIENLYARIDQYFDQFHKTYSFEIPASNGKALSWLHAHGHVLDSQQDEDTHVMTISARLSDKDAARFGKMFSTS